MDNSNIKDTNPVTHVQEAKEEKQFRSVLVNLEVDIANEFHALCKSFGSNATRLTRQLIHDFIASQQTVTAGKDKETDF